MTKHDRKTKAAVYRSLFDIQLSNSGFVATTNTEYGANLFLATLRWNFVLAIAPGRRMSQDKCMSDAARNSLAEYKSECN